MFINSLSTIHDLFTRVITSNREWCFKAFSYYHWLHQFSLQLMQVKQKWKLKAEITVMCQENIVTSVAYEHPDFTKPFT